MESRRYFRTIVLSDIHLGTSHSKVEQVCNFLSTTDCDRLILNGDIIDGHVEPAARKRRGNTKDGYHRRMELAEIRLRKMEASAHSLLQNHHEDDGELRHGGDLYKG